MRSRLAELGATASYLVEVRGSGPLLRVEAVGEDPAVVVLTAQQALDAILEELANRPELRGAPPNVAITADVLVRPTRAQELPPTVGDEDGVTHYTASGSVLLDATAAPQAPEVVNPFRQLGGSAPAILAELASTAAFRRSVAAAGGVEDYTVTSDQYAPVVRVDVGASEPYPATATVDAVFELLSTELTQRQESSPPESVLVLERLVTPETEELAPSRARPMIVVVGLGVAAAVALAVLVEGLRALVRRSRSAKAAPADTPAAAVPPRHRPPADPPASLFALAPDAIDDHETSTARQMATTVPRAP